MHLNNKFSSDGFVALVSKAQLKFRLIKPQRISSLFIKLLLALAFSSLIPGTSYAQTSVTAIALFKDRAMLSVDGSKAKIVRAGSTHAGVKVLSSSTEQAVVEINGKREVLTLNGTVDLSSELGVSTDEEGGSIELIKKPDGHFHAVGQVNGRTLNFLVDTGASIVVISSADAKRIGLEYKHGFVATASTASGDSPMYTIRAEQINVGGIELKEVSLGVIEGRFPITPLLGMSFLGELNMTQAGNNLRLEQR